MMGKRRNRGDKQTIPVSPSDTPSTPRQPQLPVTDRPGYVPGSPSRRPRTDTIPTKEGN